MSRIDESMEMVENYWAGLQSSSDIFVLLSSDMHGRKYRCPMDDSVMPEI